MVADLVGDVRRMPGVAVDLVHDLRSTMLCHPPGDPLPCLDLHSLHTVGLTTDGSAKREISGVLVGEQNRCRFGIGGAHGPRKHAREQIVELERARRDLSDLEQNVELTNLLFELLLGFEELDVLADDREEELRILD